VSICLSFATPALGEEPPEPPPTSAHYVQYGVGIGVESQLSGGDVCPSGATAPCILGSGLGMTVRVGYRSRGPWYVGGAYAASRQDASNLLRLPILQQLRGETRFYLDRGTRVVGYGTTGVGMALYGSEWSAETGGVVSLFGAGAELQISGTTVLGAAAVYRPLLLRGWVDGAGQRRADAHLGFGLAHFLGLELLLEIRSQLERW
jgi:hypothetical protein